MNNVPQSLVDIAPGDRWVVWKWENRKNKNGEVKPTKPPFMVKLGRPCGYASNDKPETWTSLQTALDAAQHADGIGLQLLGLEGVAAIDLDDVRNPDGSFQPWAADVIERAKSYGEFTPSGRGGRIIGKVALDHPTIHTKIMHPEGGHFELYVNLTEGRGRYITVTGDQIDSTPDTLADITDIVAELMALDADSDDGGRDQKSGTLDFNSRKGDMPGWVQAYLTGGGTGDRSADFQAIVNSLRPRGWSFDDLLKLFQDHPDGPAQKYIEGKRLEPELRRSWDEAGRTYRPGSGSRAGSSNDREQARSFEELMEAAKALEPGKIEDMEAIITDCAALNPMRADAVFRAIKDATGVSLTTIRAQVSQERESVPQPDHLDLARMTLDGIGRANVICTEAFLWRWQARGVWTQQDDRAVKQAVQARLDDEALIDVTASLVNSVTDVLKSDIYRPEHKFNLGNPEAVNCLNGELELQAGEWVLRPHCREHYRTTQIPVEYDPQADAPMFRAFLGQVFRDDPDRDDKAQAVLELIGYTLMSHARHERFIMLIGPGANGKSVLLAVLEGLLGSENVAGVQPSNFHEKFQRAHLHQKLANIVTELKQGEVIADAELKGITSGEPSTVEHKFQPPFVMRPFATCWFGTNHMPHTRDFSDALFRRATILQFNRTFAKSEQDPLLKDKLQAELPGILTLSLTAYARAVAQGFTEPASSEEAKKEWRLEADQVASFVEDMCHRDPHGRVGSTEVFANYKLWADQNGIGKTMSQKGLRDRLTRLGFGADRDMRGRYVTGLRIGAIQ